MQKHPSLAIVIPIYKNSFNEYEEFSFHHNIRMLSKYSIYLVGPQKLKSYIEKLSIESKICKVKLVDNSYFGSIRRNSRLMLSSFFYESFIEYNYILICHTDAIVLKDELEFWLSKKFDHIGAPMFNGENDNISFRKALNGGLTLRNVKSHLKILKSPQNRVTKTLKYRFMSGDLPVFSHWLLYIYSKLINSKLLNEDEVWAEVYPKLFPEFKIADNFSSSCFSFDRFPREVFKINNGKTPLGIHAWWRNDEEFCLNILEKCNIHFPKKIKSSKESRPSINKNNIPKKIALKIKNSLSF